MSYQPTYTDAAQDALLDAIIERARAAGQGTAVFDLDGCLFDNRTREVQMLRVWAEQHQEWRLLDLRAEHFIDWDLSTTLQRMGLAKGEADELAARIQPFWARWFFDGAYVEHDRAMPGSTRLVNAVWQAGLDVVYLTGRWHQQAEATGCNLQRFGFPWDAPNVRLATKRQGIDDLQHKHEVLSGMPDMHLMLDNEPGNVNLAHDLHPGALVVWLMTDHSPRPIVPYEQLARMRGFLRVGEV